jgi:hypothetical protein
MACRRQKSFNTHDPLGLIAVPMRPVSGGVERSGGRHSTLPTDSAAPTRVPAVVKTISGALIAAVLLVGLVAPPRPAIDSGAPSRTGISKSFAEWCPHFRAASRESIFELFERALIELR